MDAILAGHSSESDEFCDVGVWLGEGNFGKGNETLVLDTLGLKQGTITSVSLANPTNIPTTVRVTSTTKELDAFAQKLAALKELHCFSSRSPSSSDVIYSLIGKSAAGGWGGLVGIGTESDY
uniref:Uncharacterized protein n=1 Tax=Mycena chlorophos TaxID=658473 RepID=A0ABQ0M4G4_MYCCL|nr:predicted protein [Mycena chlorophos]